MTIEAIDLLGDSIYDNQSYVEQGDSVIDQISAISPVHVALHAVDGHTTTDCRLVLEDLGNDPKPTTGACISIGGNDALRMLLSYWSLAPLCWKPSLKCRKSWMNSGSTIVLCLKNCCGSMRENIKSVPSTTSSCLSYAQRGYDGTGPLQ